CICHSSIRTELTGSLWVDTPVSQVVVKRRPQAGVQRQTRTQFKFISQIDRSIEGIFIIQPVSRDQRFRTDRCKRSRRKIVPHGGGAKGKKVLVVQLIGEVRLSR